MELEGLRVRPEAAAETIVLVPERTSRTGLLLALACVTLTAVAVSFLSSSKAASGRASAERRLTQIRELEGRVRVLQAQVEEMEAHRGQWEQKAASADTQYIQQLRVAKGLEKTLAQEQWRNKTLSKQLEEQRAKMTKMARGNIRTNIQPSP